MVKKSYISCLPYQPFFLKSHRPIGQPLTLQNIHSVTAQARLSKELTLLDFLPLCHRQLEQAYASRWDAGNTASTTRSFSLSDLFKIRNFKIGLLTVSVQSVLPQSQSWGPFDSSPALLASLSERYVMQAHTYMVTSHVELSTNRIITTCQILFDKWL